MSDLSAFTPVEQSLIRYAVADYAGRWYGKVGAWTFGVDDACRYVSEAQLSKLCDRHTLKVVWRAVAAVIDEDPTVLDGRLTDAQIKAREQERRTQAEAVLAQAVAAFKTGDYAEAGRLLDAAEVVCPAIGWELVRPRAAVAARMAEVVS